MSVKVTGASSLERRLAAISNTRDVMNNAASQVRGRMVVNMRAVGARKTGLTAASLHVEGVTETHANIVGSQVAEWIDEGTGLYGPEHHRITPQTAKVLRWMGGPAGSLRLTGQARKGKAGAAAAWVYARSTKGMKARPYIAKSVTEGAKAVGVALSYQIVKEWDGAA